MADQPGFFEQLIGTQVDETAAHEASIAADVKAGGRLAQMFHGFGRQAAGGLGVALSGSRSGDVKDALVAQSNGIQVEELRARRRIRKETSEVVDDGSFSARRKMAEIAARIANEEGDAKGLARALAATQQLKEQEAQWEQLQAKKTKAQADAVDAQIANGFNSDGTGVSGIRAIQDGRAGVWTEVDGELIFKPFNEGFSQVDPSRRGGQLEPVSKRIARISSTAERAKIRGLAASADSSVRKTDRVLSTLTDLFEEGGVESVIGTSGRVITSVDNLVRNVNGIISAFSSKGAAADSRPGQNRSFAGRDGLVELAEDAGNSFSSIIQLPSGVEATSSAAQQHRAAVMEMAYMAARLAEPSNRGLSDNDIKNALTRIAGDTSNPQVMMRRFLEMQIDAAHDLDFNLRLFHGSLGEDVSDEEIDQVLTGKGLGEYRARKEALFAKFGITEESDGRATFGEGFSIGVDVQPGEGTGVDAEQTINIEDMSDEDAAKALGL